MRLSAAVLRLFASPESQTLKAGVRIKLPRAISRRWNSHVRFAIWYSKTLILKKHFASRQFVVGRRDSSRWGGGRNCSGNCPAQGRRGNRFVRFVFMIERSAMLSMTANTDETVSLKSLRAAFNSPFPAYVLVSTSVARKVSTSTGICASVIHWSPPSSPSSCGSVKGASTDFRPFKIRRALQVAPDANEAAIRNEPRLRCNEG